ADMLENGTALDVGLGIAPASGKTARHGVLLEKRDRLIRHVRKAVPDWRDLSDNRAAAAMILSFDRYAAGGWAADRKRDTAPAPEPTATFWRLLRLGLPQKKAMPRKTALADILRGEGGG
ncbi:hypothetical protein G5B31_20765, partial [Rhodobacter sp. SGA-6-6]|nr:hypothetical protein [Rhodobacter sp. SGA-6-6]